MRNRAYRRKMRGKYRNKRKSYAAHEIYPKYEWRHGEIPHRIDYGCGCWYCVKWENEDEKRKAIDKIHKQEMEQYE